MPQISLCVVYKRRPNKSRASKSTSEGLCCLPPAFAANEIRLPSCDFDKLPNGEAQGIGDDLRRIRARPTLLMCSLIQVGEIETCVDEQHDGIFVFFMSIKCLKLF